MVGLVARVRLIRTVEAPSRNKVRQNIVKLVGAFEHHQPRQVSYELTGSSYVPERGHEGTSCIGQNPKTDVFMIRHPGQRGIRDSYEAAGSWRIVVRSEARSDLVVIRGMFF